MKYCRKLWPLLGLVALLFYSCEQDDGTFENDSGNMSSHPFVQETRAYFEDYISMEMEFETWGMHPGLIAPDWEKAKIFTQSGTMSVDVPLWTEASYEGSFYMRNDSSGVSSTDTYYTAILQKLIVVKSLEKDAFSCYIATIIPDAEHATRNSSLIANMFYGGDTNSKFSGTVIYSTVTTNYTIAVERYKEGMLCEEVSLFYVSADVSDDYEAMIRLINAKNIQRSVRVMTRNGEMGEGGYMLPEVVVTGNKPTPPPPPPPPPPSLPPPLPPPLPPLPPVTNPPIIPPPPTSSGGGNSGGSSGINQNKIPKVKHNSNDPLQVQLAAQINVIIAELYPILLKMGVDLSTVEIKLVSGNFYAYAKKDGRILGISISFVNTSSLTKNDRLAIVWHEMFHLNNDRTTYADLRHLSEPVYLSGITKDLENYVRNELLKEESDKEIAFNDYMTVYQVHTVQWYENEINTYEAEIKQNMGESETYKRERAFKLWLYRQKREIAKKNNY